MTTQTEFSAVDLEALTRSFDLGCRESTAYCLHLSAIEKGECIQLLVSQNYKVVTGSNDMIAFQPRYMYA